MFWLSFLNKPNPCDLTTPGSNLKCKGMFRRCKPMPPKMGTLNYLQLLLNVLIWARVWNSADHNFLSLNLSHAGSPSR